MAFQFLLVLLLRLAPVSAFLPSQPLASSHRRLSLAQQPPPRQPSWYDEEIDAEDGWKEENSPNGANTRWASNNAQQTSPATPRSSSRSSSPQASQMQQPQSQQRYDNDREPSNAWKEYEEEDDFEEDDYYFNTEDDVEYDTDPQSSGNYWFNSVASADDATRTNVRETRRPQRRDDAASQRTRRPPLDRSRRPRSRSRPTTFRSGTPPPPAPVTGFYDRLFWYGLDEEVDGQNYNSAADKTMFGGMKGKFNGLGFLGDLDKQPPNRLLLGPSGRRRDDAYDDKYDDEEYDDDIDYQARRRPERRLAGERRRLLEESDDYSRVSSRSRRGGNDEYDDDDDDDDDEWMEARRRRNRRRRNPDPNPISTWFTDNEDDEQDQRRPRRRRRERRDEDWASSFNLIDSFFGFNREGQRDRQAQLYNQRMGLNSWSTTGDERDSRSRRRKRRYDYDDDEDDFEDDDDRSDRRRTRRRPQSTPRRSGYAYKYNKDDDDYDDRNNRNNLKGDDGLVADYEIVPEYDEDDNNDEKDKTDNQRPSATAASANGKTSDRSSSSPSPSETPSMSWEERALALERVPPANLLAWGPSGVVQGGVDARSVAIQDALTDVLEAKRRLADKQAAVDEAKQTLSLRRVDQALAQKQQQKNQRSRRYDDRDQDLEWKLQEDVEQASREYRWALKMQEVAQEDLNDLERRHWAVLQFYNPTKAEAMVKETLQEIRDLGGSSGVEAATVGSSSPSPSSQQQER